MSTEIIIGAGLPTNKAEIEAYNVNVKELALSGEVDIIKMARSIKVMEKIVKQFNDDKDIQDSIVMEAEKYGKGELPEIQIREVGSKTDYAVCNHPQYNRICSEIDSLTEQIKSLELYLKSITRPTNFIDPETGEEVILNPPVKTSTTKAVFTIK
jgi:hypothetical protein